MRITPVLIVLFSFLLSSPLYGQLEKGSFLLDIRGQTGYDSEEDFFIPRLYAKVGYFPMPGLAVGIRVGGYGHLMSGRNFGDAMYGGFARYYFNPASDNYFFYGELEAGVIANYQESQDTRTLPIIQPTVGADFLTEEFVIIEGALGISIIENPNTGQMRFNNFVMRIGWKTLISETSREIFDEMREENESYFRSGTVSLSSGFVLNSDFVPERFLATPITDFPFSSESINYNNLSDNRSNYFSFNAGVGFFLSDKTMFGLNMGITNFGGSDTEATTTLFSIEPSLRYYLSLGENNRTHLYFRGGYEFGGLNIEGLGSEYSYGYANGGVGINYMLNPGTALELGVDYGWMNVSEAILATESFNVIKFNYGLRVFL